jgi:dTDP-4-amino-4,6-dideoxygalactose transaminase
MTGRNVGAGTPTTANGNAGGSKSGSIPLLDVGRGNGPLREEILQTVAEVIDSGRFLHGPDVKKLEEEIAALSGAKQAIACASGSDALLLALMALEVQTGDEVIVPSFTFFATASAAWRLGARPVFVDIDRATFNLDPAKIEASITPATKAIIAVHLFGQCAEMDAIQAIAERHGIAVIEDTAQSLGAGYRGRGAGSIGQLGATSFYPTKNLGGFGDGGMITTNDDTLADRVRLYAAHGMQPRYYHHVVGINSRLDTIQAAVLRVKLRHLSDWSRKRQENASRYQQSLQGIPGLELPVATPHGEHVWNQYTVRVLNGRRDWLRDQLTRCGIGTEIYYPVPLHQQICFRSLGYQTGSLPETERTATEVLSLPIYPEMTSAEQQCVITTIRELLTAAKIAA